MPTIRQPQLPLVLHASAALVPVDAARVTLGVDEDSVISLIESGAIRWAWDISTGQRQLREVRIWARCLAAMQSGSEQPGRTVEEIATEILGTGPDTRIRAAVVRAILCCSQLTIKRLVDEAALDGVVVGQKRWIERRSLIRFLSNRRIQ